MRKAKSRPASDPIPGGRSLARLAAHRARVRLLVLRSCQQMLEELPDNLLLSALDHLQKLRSKTPPRPRGQKGRPLKWTSSDVTKLGDEYRMLKGGMSRELVLSFLGDHYHLSRRTIEGLLTRKRTTQKIRAR
jgi:hypothetical protein